MKVSAFSVFDKAVRAFLPPFFTRSKGEALRSFTEACNDEKHQFRKHPEDYVLMFLGEFDDESGVFETVEPTRLVGAYEVRVDDPFQPETRATDGSPRLPM